MTTYAEAIAKIRLRAERKEKRREKAKELGLRKPKLDKIPLLIKKNDAIFSLIIRGRDAKRGCPFFHEVFTPVQCCFHIIPRGKHWVRWDMDNAVGSCHSCNYRYEQDHFFVHDVIAWVRKNVPRYEEIMLIANTKEPMGRERLEKIHSDLLAKIQAPRG